MKALDPFSIDLEKTTLIEASAGTGKTFTIATLYCRLVARGYPVESILVVTFTEAAAAELKIRVRQRLAHSARQLEAANDKDVDELVLQLLREPDTKRVVQRLRAAVTSFDQASIMTIHSFCLKALKENAFESRSLFDIQLVPDRAVFFNQVVCDYFMARINHLDPLFLDFLASRNFTPESVTRTFSNLVSRHDLTILPTIEAFEERFEDYKTIVQNIAQVLNNEKESILELIQSHNGLNKRSYSKKNVPQWLDQTHEQIQTAPVPLFKLAEKGDPIYRFTTTCMAFKTKSGSEPPQHLFFDLCQDLLEIYQGFERNLIYLKIAFLRFFNDQLKTMKSSQGLCFFDDLVNDLAASLNGPSKNQLKSEIRSTFQACLIDEFQDTDPSQYMIFSSLFNTPGTPFFMVGDPKQAIYAFRGGDIFAYLKASHESEQQATLISNYRSAPLLVNGVNAVFSHQQHPFLFDDIEFTPVGTPPTAVDRLIKDGKKATPLTFCFIERQGRVLDKQGMISKDHARQVIPKAVANDMLTLLSTGRALKKNQKDTFITPGDIAVLVRTNAQAGMIQQALSANRIPCFQSATGSVYDSPQAVELYDILWAIQHPNQKALIKAALATSVFGFTARDMIDLEENETALYHFQHIFSVYKEEWKTHGFVTMIHHLLHSKDTFLKSDEYAGNRPDERAMTNFYHLIELISQALVNKDLSPQHLFKWYTDQLNASLRDESADQLRLESDKQAVSIVTIHKSKGLEYPVVYLPYLWEGQRPVRSDLFLFHDPDHDNDLTLDLGSSDSDRSKTFAGMEETAEQRRLLYVALTRASAACRIFWGGFQSVEKSALGSILHPAGVAEDTLMQEDIQTLITRATDSIELELCDPDRHYPLYRVQQQGSGALSCQVPSRKVEPAWAISSFSALTQAAAVYHDTESVSEKNTEHEETAGQKEIILNEFPKGAWAGDFFHAIYEKLDFTDPEGIQRQVDATARLTGYTDEEGIHAAVQSVSDVLATPLQAETEQIRLNQVYSDNRFNELEFFFSVDHLDTRILKKAVELSDPLFVDRGYVNALDPVASQKFKGFIKGFIDLIIVHKGKWYILDYKTNFLGETYGDYGQDALFTAMMDHHYFLQYHIYLIALHRYLGRRLANYDYNRHFGGVFYLFVRGMTPELASKTGVFFHKPGGRAIEYLNDHL